MAVYALDVQYTFDGMPLMNSEGVSIAYLSLLWPIVSVYCKSRSYFQIEWILSKSGVSLLLQARRFSSTPAEASC
jgi:hypothetical protein